MDKNVLDALDPDRLRQWLTAAFAEAGLTSVEFLKNDLLVEKAASAAYKKIPLLPFRAAIKATIGKDGFTALVFGIRDQMIRSHSVDLSWLSLEYIKTALSQPTTDGPNEPKSMTDINEQFERCKLEAERMLYSKDQDQQERAAAAMLEEALVLKPESVDLWILLSDTCDAIWSKLSLDILEEREPGEATKYREKAFRSAQRAIQLDPTSGKAHHQLGNVFWPDDFRKSLAEYETAARFDSQFMGSVENARKAVESATFRVGDLDFAVLGAVAKEPFRGFSEASFYLHLGTPELAVVYMCEKSSEGLEFTRAWLFDGKSPDIPDDEPIGELVASSDGKLSVSAGPPEDYRDVVRKLLMESPKAAEDPETARSQSAMDVSLSKLATNGSTSAPGVRTNSVTSESGQSAQSPRASINQDEHVPANKANPSPGPVVPIGGERQPCTACGTSNPATARYCKNCGKSLLPPSGGAAVEKVPSQGVRCGSCHAENITSALFCKQCGGKLVADQPFSTGPVKVSAEPADSHRSTTEKFLQASISNLPLPAATSSPVGTSYEAESSGPLSLADTPTGTAVENAPTVEREQPLPINQSESEKAGVPPPPAPDAPRARPQPDEGVPIQPVVTQAERTTAPPSAPSTTRRSTFGIWSAAGIAIVVVLTGMYVFLRPLGPSIPGAADPSASVTGLVKDPAAAFSPDQPAVASMVGSAEPLVTSSPNPSMANAHVQPMKSGKQVYVSVCKACHESGKSGSPRISDATAWKERLAKGKPYLYASAMNGRGPMLACGGAPDLRAEEIRAGVDFMVVAVARAERLSRAANRQDDRGPSPGQTGSPTADTKLATKAPSSTTENWLTLMRAELDECRKAGFLQRVLCTERVRWKYCAPDRWEKFPECAVQKTESSNPN